MGGVLEGVTPDTATAGKCHMLEASIGMKSAKGSRLVSWGGGGSKMVQPFLSANTAAASATSTAACFFLFSGKDSAMPSLRPWQNCRTGQRRHWGDLGEQSVAPSSITA